MNKRSKRRDLKLVGQRSSNLYGLRFGQLIVVEIAERRDEKLYWLCKCMCGEKIVASQADLKNRRVNSCGRPMCMYKAMLAEHQKSIDKRKIQVG